MRRSPVLAAVVLAVAVGAAACGTSDDGAAATTTTTSTTEAPPLTGTTRPPTLEQLKSVISFAPVLSVAPCETTDPPADEPVSTETTVPIAGSDVTRDARGDLCYRLGPTMGDGNDLTGAEVADVGLPEPAVSVRAQPASVDRLNQAFDACYLGEPTCPPAADPGGRGAMAIVYQGAVVSAPSVQGGQLASDGFTITGEFTEAEATDLAELLNRTS